MKTMKLAMIGYGNVGRAFTKMLERRKMYLSEMYDTEILITAICTRSLGAILDPDGIRTAAETLPEGDKSISAMDVITKTDYDILVELTPVNIMTGQPATDHIRSALNRGKHVITANKGPVAWAYRELRDLAKKNGVLFCHEGTVMDGVPVYNLAENCLKGCRIEEVRGIFNATTNYILNEIEKGVSYEDAIREGQKRGFVEADPSLDVDGWDAAAKLTALMNVLMDVSITPTEIERTGIRSITREEILQAAANDQKIKLLCRGWVENGQVRGTVKPTLVAKDELYATINGTAAVVTVKTDLMGEISIVEHVYEPEIDQTAYAVLSDLLKIIERRRSL